MIAAYLFFAGHNRPGGGFAAGLVLGAVIVLRTVAGLHQPNRPRWSPGDRRRHPRPRSRSAPLLWGEPLLDQAVVEWDVPVLGKIKSGRRRVFDLGVVALVVGLVVALLDGLGAEVVDLGLRTERPTAREGEAAMSVAMIFAIAGLAGVGMFLVMSRSLSRIVLGFALLGHAAVLALLAAGGPAGDTAVRRRRARSPTAPTRCPRRCRSPPSSSPSA